MTPPREDPDRSLPISLARAFGGAIFFSLPLLMTMEMWRLGFYIDRARLALFIVVMLPVLFGLSRFSGIRDTGGWTEDVVDAFIAIGVGIVASAAILFLLDIISFGMSVREVVGKITIETVPASLGAMLARSQFGIKGRKGEERKRRAGYWGELFLMLAGAVFLAFAVAPTEEMIVIAFKMSEWHALGLAVASMVMMHAFVYAVAFKGEAVVPENTPWWSLFLRFTVVGYALSLLVSGYVLWTFGRTALWDPSILIQEAIVLAFPASLGAAAARLLL